MPAPTLTPEQRTQAREAMLVVMRKSGKNFDAKAFAEQHGVPLPTIYRWRKEIHQGGVAAQNRLRRERQKARRKTREAAELYGDAQAKAKALEALADELPQVPAGSAGLGLDVGKLAQRLEDCAEAAEKLIAFASTEDGKVRAPKTYLRGVELKRRVAETVPRILGFLWDVNQAERTVKIAFEVIGEAEPEVAHRIIERLKQKNREMGLF